MKKPFRSIAVGLVAAALTLGMAPMSGAAAQYDSVVLNIGADDTQRNLVWYATATDGQVVSVQEMGNAASATTIAPVKSKPANKDGYTYHQATIDGLKASTTYEYKVGSETDGWSETYEFTTAGDDNFQFLAYGDPQIGSGGGIPTDADAWQNTLDVSLAAHPDADFLMSLGDQVNTAGSESEYTEFLAPDELRTNALSTNIGNHDNGSDSYGQHFFMPNTSTTAGTSSDREGLGNFWYEFNDTLFLSFNSNNRDDAAHFEWAKQVIAEHGEGTNWQIASMHHGPYSTASHTHDGDIIARRATWPVAMSDMGIDLVLGGHDHIYSRSHLLNDGWPVGDLSAPSTLGQFEDEVLWITLNSATGSKYYTEQFWEGGAQFPFNAVSVQNRTANYSVLNVSDDAIQVITKTVEGTIVDDVTITMPAADATQTPRPDGDAPTDFRVQLAGEKPVANVVDENGVTHVEGRTLQGFDDVEERIEDGSMYMDSSDLELIRDGSRDQMIGMRFDALQIPAGAEIQNAYIQFTVDEPAKSVDPAKFEIAVEKTGNAAKYVEEDAFNVSKRTYLDETVTWEPAEWGIKQEAGADQRTPDLASLVQAIVDGDDWVRGNAMAFAVTGEGVRVAEAYEGGESEEAPKLMVEYKLPGQSEIVAPIAKAEDDLEEHVATNELDHGSSDLELGYEKKDAQIVGMRYDLDIPKGAKIEDAYVQFTTDEADKSVDPFDVKIQAAAEDNVEAFGNTNGALSGYTRTDATVTWNDAPIWELDQEQRAAQRTPNIASVLQEVVNRDGWKAGNGLALLVEGEGARSAESYEGGGAEEAPILYVRWSEGDGDDSPVVDAPAASINAAALTVAGRDSYIWGTTTPGATVRTQVYIEGYGWATSQIGTANAKGGYLLPLTYGKDSAGTRQWRVVVDHADGDREITDAVTQKRLARPTLATAGTKKVGATTNGWGKVDGKVPTTITTQVWIEGRGWTNSQTASTKADGGYVIELTYGKNTAGTYRWRIAANYEGFGVVTSDEAKLVRR